MSSAGRCEAPGERRRSAIHAEPTALAAAATRAHRRAALAGSWSPGSHERRDHWLKYHRKTGFRNPGCTRWARSRNRLSPFAVLAT